MTLEEFERHTKALSDWLAEVYGPPTQDGAYLEIWAGGRLELAEEDGGALLGMRDIAANFGWETEEDD